MNHDRYSKHSHGAAAETKRQQSSRKETTMQEYKDWDGNLLPDPAPRIRNIHIGDIIKTTQKIIEEPLETRGRGQHRFISEPKEYEVTAVYPRMIQTRDRKTGFTRCFSYGDLLTMGIESQGPDIEEMRKIYEKDQIREKASIRHRSSKPDYDPEKYRPKKKKGGSRDVHDSE